MAGEVAGAARAARLGWNGLRATMLVGASSGAASGAGASGYAYMTGPGPHIVEGFVGNALASGLGGGLMGGGISAIGHGLARGISNVTGHSVMADPTILSGHGGILEGDATTFTLPKGVSIRFYTPLGARMYDPEANAVEAGSRRWPFIGAHSHPYEVAGPGSTIPDHVLHPPDSRITITGNPVTAVRPTRLSAPVGMYEVRTYDWAACREVVPPKGTS